MVSDQRYSGAVLMTSDIVSGTRDQRYSTMAQVTKVQYSGTSEPLNSVQRK
jgi:hypothetical protein